MILESILNETSDELYRKVAPQLRRLGGSPELLESMDIEDLRVLKADIKKSRAELLRTLSPGHLPTNEEYSKLVLEESALDALVNSKSSEESDRQLVPGITYYRKVSVSGNRISGERCKYLGEGRMPPSWSKFDSDVRVEKALTLIEHGEDTDFAKIYYLLANGTKNGQRKVVIEHISRSTDRNLAVIERYCDARWDGEWPWQAPVPGKLRNIIEGRKMKKNKIVEMRDAFKALLEGETEKAEVLVSGKDISDQVGSMISNLAKVSATLMADYKTMVTTEFGKEAVAGLDAIYGSSVEQAITALSHLKDAIDEFVSGLDGSGAAPDLGMPGEMGGDPLAPPGDPTDPLAGDADPLAEPGAEPGEEMPPEDAIDDLGGERPKKV